METWQELKVTVKREGEELVSNLLIELGAQGVAIEDSMDYVGNVNCFGEISQRSSNKKKSWSRPTIQQRLMWQQLKRTCRLA